MRKQEKQLHKSSLKDFEQNENILLVSKTCLFMHRKYVYTCRGEMSKFVKARSLKFYEIDSMKLYSCQIK